MTQVIVVLVVGFGKGSSSLSSGEVGFGEILVHSRRLQKSRKQRSPKRGRIISLPGPNKVESFRLTRLNHSGTSGHG